jgi:hypothetical protein
MFRRFIALALALAAAPLAAQTRTDPDSVQLVTTDVAHFWEAWHAMAGARTRADSLQLLQTLYFDRGTPGLRDFTTSRIGSADKLLATIQRRPRYYAAVERTTQDLSVVVPELRKDLRTFARLYPGAAFPDVYFTIGRLNSGGTTGDAGLLIGTEMYSADSTTPRDELTDWERSVLHSPGAIPCLVTHELVHYQQPDLTEQPPLLVAVIREGSADFVAELACGSTINVEAYRWADQHRAELIAEFRQKMDGTDYSGWLYGVNQVPGRPADVGYWMGYQISKAYYDQASDKAQALRHILRPSDYKRLWEESGADR